MIRRLIRFLDQQLPWQIVIFGMYIYKITYVRALPEKNKVYDLGSFKMKINQKEDISRVKRRFKSYEPEVSKVISESLDSGSIYIDIGSNKGYHVLEAASIVGEEGSVFSFEPHPENYSDLCENIDLNDFHQVQSKRIALFNEDGSSNFAEANKSGRGFVSEQGDIEVKLMKFDSFIYQEGDVSMDSIDCINSSW